MINVARVQFLPSVISGLSLLLVLAYLRGFSPFTCILVFLQHLQISIIVYKADATSSLNIVIFLYFALYIFLLLLFQNRVSYIHCICTCRCNTQLQLWRVTETVCNYVAAT